MKMDTQLIICFLLVLGCSEAECGQDNMEPVLLGGFERVYAGSKDFVCYDDMVCTPERCSSGNFSLMANFNELRSCDCHDGCYEFGTCCFNYEEACSSNQPQTEDLRFRRDSNIVSCMNMPAPTRDTPEDKNSRMFVVNKCKRPLVDGIGEDDVRMCENLDEIFEQFIPIYRGGLLYRNVYCLRCNGFTVEDTGLFIDIGIECRSKLVRVRGPTSFETQSYADLKPFIESESCRFVYDMDFPHLYCYRSFNDTCDPLLENTLPDFNFLQDACRSYAFYVEHFTENGNGRYFKNPHCAQCNGITNVSCISEDRPNFRGTDVNRYNYVPTLSILLDFSGQVSTKLIPLRDCENMSDDGSYLDMKANKCSQKLCPPGYILMNSTHCIVSEAITFQHLHSEPVQDSESDYAMQIFLKYTKSCSYDKIAEEIQAVMTKQNPRKSMLVVTSSNCTTEDKILCVEFLIATGGFYDDILFITSEEFSGHLEDLNAEVDIVEFRFVAPSHHDNDNIDELHHSDNPTFTMNETGMASTMRNAMKHNHWSSRIYVYLPEFDSTVTLQQMYFDTRITKDEFGMWKTRQTAAVGIDNHFNCSRCDACIVYRHPLLGEWDIESELTRWFSFLSISALILSLIIRCLTPDQIGFFKVMQVCIQVSLLLAHLFFVINNFTPLPRVWCVVDASFQHFFWLSSFAFMNVVNMLLYRAFRSVHVNNNIGMISKQMYMLYGWGFSGAVVIATLIVHFCWHPVYAEQGVCWIDGAINLALVFGLPVAVMLAANIVLFIMTSVALNRAMKQTARVTDAYTFKYRLHLHLRLLAIMGGAWVFGFLSNIPQLQFLSYPFVVLVSLNGFFVALATNINAQMIRTIKSRISSLGSN